LGTLEEIAIREKENFLNAGGESFTFIPCMNVQEPWIKAMITLLENAK
jgi:ferrochelatase